MKRQTKAQTQKPMEMEEKILEMKWNPLQNSLINRTNGACLFTHTHAHSQNKKYIFSN